MRYLFLNFLLIAMTVRANINIKLPTLGGKLFWTDVKIVNDWIIQENVISGHCRLINNNKIRYAWGSEDYCIQELSKLTHLSSEQKTVILIHGLGIRKQSLISLVDPLEKEGFKVIKFGYSAFFEPLESCAFKLESVLSSYNGKVYLVTHSMGGILVRQHQQTFRRKIDGVVMIAPPNNGAKIVDRLSKLKVSSLLGVNGKRLTTDCHSLPKTLAGINSPLLIIAGTKKRDVGYFPLFNFTAEDNDGVISLETTKLAYPHTHISVKGYHLTLMKQKYVHTKIIDFLTSV